MVPGGRRSEPSESPPSCTFQRTAWWCDLLLDSRNLGCSYSVVTPNSAHFDHRLDAVKATLGYGESNGRCNLARMRHTGMTDWDCIVGFPASSTPREPIDKVGKVGTIPSGAENYTCARFEVRDSSF